MRRPWRCSVHLWTHTCQQCLSSRPSLGWAVIMALWWAHRRRCSTSRYVSPSPSLCCPDCSTPCTAQPLKTGLSHADSMEAGPSFLISEMPHAGPLLDPRREAWSCQRATSQGSCTLQNGGEKTKRNMKIRQPGETVTVSMPIINYNRVCCTIQ